MEPTSTPTTSSASPLKRTTTTTQPVDIDRELDEVVGRYEPHAHERWVTRYGRWAARALLAACLAIGAAIAIFATLDTHMRQAQTAPPPPQPPRPVMVDIVPAK